MIDDAAKNSAVILNEAKDLSLTRAVALAFPSQPRRRASPNQTAELPLIKQLGPIHALALKHD